ncbi:MAG: hypothetical protein ACRD88_01220, partial [Terriglobia bacterium]
ARLYLGLQREARTSRMGQAPILAESWGGIPWSKRLVPQGIGRWFCAASLAVLVLVSSSVALTEYRNSDDFRLVGQIDFSTALQYFQQTSGFGRNEYRPIVLLSFAWDNLLWGDRAFGYHLTNVLLHVANAVLLLLVFQRLTGNLLPAFLGAALFAFHPVHHSRIAWISARDGSLSTLFLLIAWLLYLSARERGPESSSNRAGLHLPDWTKHAASHGAFLLALLSYEGAAAFPLVLAAMEVCLPLQPGPWKERVRQAAWRTAPYFLLLIFYFAGWLVLFGGSIGAYDLEWSGRGILRNFYALHYNVFYHIQRWPALIYVLVATLVWRQRRGIGGLLGFAWLVIWLGYLPFLLIQGFASRFAYFSSMGVALFLALCAMGLRNWSRRELLSPSLSVLLLLGLVAYYAHFSGQRLHQWVEAGQIAETIPAQLKALRPSFPSNTTLVFDQIPAMHRDAYVFPTGLRAAVRGKYSEPLPEIHYSPTAIEPSSGTQLMQQQSAFHFRYAPEQERLLDISSPAVLEAEVR